VQSSSEIVVTTHQHQHFYRPDALPVALHRGKNIISFVDVIYIVAYCGIAATTPPATTSTMTGTQQLQQTTTPVFLLQPTTTGLDSPYYLYPQSTAPICTAKVTFYTWTLLFTR